MMFTSITPLRKYFLFLLFSLFVSNVGITQSIITDSLKKIVDDINNHDTTRILAYCDLSQHYNSEAPVKASDYLNKAYKKSIEIEYSHGQALSLLRLGVLNYEQGNIKDALEFWFKSIDIYKKIGNKKGRYFEETATNGLIDNLTWIARSYCGIGEMENFEKHLAEVKQLLKKEKTDFSRVAWITIEWAGCYYSNGKYKEALKQFKMAYDYFKEVNDHYGMANTLANIGMVEHKLGNINTAISSLQESLKRYKEMNSVDGVHWAYNIIGNVYSEMHNFDSAYVNYEKGMLVAKQNNQEQSLLSSYLNLGRLYESSGKVVEGLPYWNKAYDLSLKYKMPEYILITGIYLAEYHERTGDFDKAIKYYKQYIQLKDSLDDSENMKSIGKLEAKYDFEKTRLLQEKKHQKELDEQNALSAAEKQKQWIIIIAVGFGLLAVLVFSVFLYRRNIATRKQNKIIEQQKREVETKNKEILDSINYAKRIQAAVLPSNTMVKNYLPNSFILYKPKDIVAGDFYWMEVRGDTTLVAACDCTGHGVPGAMVSVICNNGLNRSVREHHITDPGKILDKTREIVVQEFEKSDTTVNDGMDLALISLKKNGISTQLKYAGANNPLWIIRNGKDSVEELKPSKQHIGKYEKAVNYETQLTDLAEGDVVYLFTDGYKDQFGYDTSKKGRKEEKFKTSRLRKLLFEIHQLDMEAQKQKLASVFNDWKKDLEQLDDICFIGIRI